LNYAVDIDVNFTQLDADWSESCSNDPDADQPAVWVGQGTAKKHAVAPGRCSSD